LLVQVRVGAGPAAAPFEGLTLLDTGIFPLIGPRHLFRAGGAPREVRDQSRTASGAPLTIRPCLALVRNRERVQQFYGRRFVGVRIRSHGRQLRLGLHPVEPSPKLRHTPVDCSNKSVPNRAALIVATNPAIAPADSDDVGWSSVKVRKANVHTLWAIVTDWPYASLPTSGGSGPSGTICSSGRHHYPMNP
jgi:hypothetical protein